MPLAGVEVRAQFDSYRNPGRRLGSRLMPRLIIICGLSFSGKSTLGKALAQTLGCAEVYVDETKFRLHGPHVKDTDFSREQWDNIYRATDKEIENCQRLGKSVIDATRNFRKVERDRLRVIADKLGVSVTTIYVNTSESVARERWLANRLKPSRRDISDRDFEEIVAVMEPPTAAEHYLTFDHRDDLENWISKWSSK
jgi:predicted kinase